jgi:ferrous iron transport protein A
VKTLRQARIGETVTVKKLHGEGAVKRRIMDMRITSGVEVYVRKVAPLGDLIEVMVRGYELSIRNADAEMIDPFDPRWDEILTNERKPNSYNESIRAALQT